MQDDTEVSDSLVEAIARCLLNDSDIRFLLSVAMTKMANERLKRNLATLLETFARGLSIDLILSWRYMGPFVRSRLLEIVDQVLSKISSETQSRSENSLPSYGEPKFTNDERQDIVETPCSFDTPEPVEVRKILSQFNDTMLHHATSFTTMKEDLRRFVFPSMKSYIRETILPSLLPMNSNTYSVAVLVHWELEEHIDHEVGTVYDIDNVLTLNGELMRAQALPCGEYMQQTWPQTGAATLNAVKRAVLEGHSSHPYSRTHSMQLKLEHIDATLSDKSECAISRPLHARMKGTLAEVVERIEQFAWFASAFRSVGENTTGPSQVDFRVVSKSSESQELMIELVLLPIRSYASCITDTAYGPLWLSLMKSSALAWGFPIKERGQILGLEIPFELMFKSSPVPVPSLYRDSIIIHAGNRVIYPTAKHPDGVQWHVFPAPKGIDYFHGDIEFLEAHVTGPLVLPMGYNAESFSRSDTWDAMLNNCDPIWKSRTFFG